MIYKENIHYITKKIQAAINDVKQNMYMQKKNNKHENRTTILRYCCLLIILSIYAYINSKPMIMSVWIRPPWMLYYDLYFTLYELSAPLEPTGKTINKTYHGRETCQFLFRKENH